VITHRVRHESCSEILFVTNSERLDYTLLLDNERLDLIYPPEIRELSDRHWTPVAVARRAAEFLVSEPNTRVLDLGCGPGKFCIVGALTTAGHFTGVEQRQQLAHVARKAIQRGGISNAEIFHANVTEIDFQAYDAFYLFNPFEENLFTLGKIDESVELSKALYDQYTSHVAAQLARARLGTRLVTYFGLCDEVPACYECREYTFGGELKLWEKTREMAEDASLDALPKRGRWRFLFDFAAHPGDWGPAFGESEES